MALLEFKPIGSLNGDGELAPMSESERDRIEKVKDRVMKLLAKAKGEGATQAEREEAMEFAAKFARHANLELYEIEREMGKKSEYVLRKMQIPGHAKWQYQLATSIAEALIVRIVFHHAPKLATKPNARTGSMWRNPLADFVSLVGSPGDIELVDYLFEYIVAELTKVAKRQYKLDALKAELAWEKPNPKRWHDNFYRGAVASLSYRLEAMFKAEERELQRKLKVRELAELKRAEHEALTDEEQAVLADETLVAEARTMALVPLKDAEVKEAEKEFFPNLSKKGIDLFSRPKLPAMDKVGYKRAREAEATRKNAYMAGRQAGADLELRRALNGRSTKAIEGAAS